MTSFTLRHLSTFRGLQGTGKIYVAIKGEVFDVTTSRHLYGQGTTTSSRATTTGYTGGPYEIFAGREIARALALFDFEEYGSSKTDDLDKDQLLSLKEWIDKFRGKYKSVGRVIALAVSLKRRSDV